MKSLVAVPLLALAAIRAPAQSSGPSTAVLTEDETARIMADITAVQREYAKTKKEVRASMQGVISILPAATAAPTEDPAEKRDAPGTPPPGAPQ